jgi:hypothetical protein
LNPIEEFFAELVTFVQARHLQIDSSLLSYSSRRPVDENIKLEGRKEEAGKQETSKYRWTCGHVSQTITELRAFIKRNWQVYEENPGQGFGHFLRCLLVFTI